MGQYHMVVDMTAMEGLNPHGLGTGLKEWEIVAAGAGLCAALVGLISTMPGNEPADLGSDPMVGRWAGHRILAAGDYAGDQDIPGFDGPPLSELYSLVVKGDEARKRLAENPKFAGLPTFLDIAPQCQGMVEQGASVRFCGEGWLVRVPVRTTATMVGADGRARYELATKDSEALSFFDRLGIREESWQRPPRNDAWCGIRDGEVDQGQTRLLVSLDKREFIDPVKFGEVPTTAGIMAGDWGAASALGISLFHPERRGGGDLPDDEPDIAAFKGRWRNTRLVALGTREAPDMPTLETVRATFTDVSAEALRAVALAKAW